jgi:hypothetical protein
MDVAILAMLAGCTVPSEVTHYNFGVWNHSSSQYSVRVTTKDGGTRLIGVPADAIVEGTDTDEPVSAIVYDYTCSSQLADVAFLPGVPFVVIDAQGVISAVPQDLMDPGRSHPPIGGYSTVPASCPASSAADK